MEFWLTAGVIVLLSGLWIARPYFKARSIEMTSSDGAISIYRDQMDELERDLKAGQISESEFASAKMEIERRALSAARRLDTGFLSSPRSLVTAAVLVLCVCGFTTALYSEIGAPRYQDMPLVARKTEEMIRRAEAGDIGSRIQLLIERTENEPESFESWWMLARSYAAVGDHASSADAYRHVVDLAEGRPAVLSAYAEAMTLANGNKVPSAERVIFEQLAAEQADPRARYYVALAKAQSQDFQNAIDDWALLARDSAPDAPWMPLVRRDIVNMARFLQVDVTTYLSDATDIEIASSGQSGSASVQVSSLVASLEADPMDHKGWIALARARSEQGDTEGAVEAITSARRHFAGAPFVLDLIAQAEFELGLDLLPPSSRGPTKEEMVAASNLSQSERDDMIAGMVAGFAARLETQPNDPDGWVMLVRSYATLGQHEKAREAARHADIIFENDLRVQQAIRSQTQGLLDVD